MDPILQTSIRITTILAVGFLVHQGARLLLKLLEGRATNGREDAHARGVLTQLALLRRLGSILIGAVTISLVLLQFSVVRDLGVSILASAGIAGVVVGFAAQKSLGTLFSGIQLSIAQPVRLGDAVVIENEFGTVEELRLTFVVVRLGDSRRLVVPIAYFLDRAFQNWSRGSGDLIGNVDLIADYMAPIDELRAELVRVCEESDSWNKRLAQLEVYVVGERSITLRATVSADDPAKLAKLRAELREKLLVHLRSFEGGKYLPQRADGKQRG